MSDLALWVVIAVVVFTTGVLAIVSFVIKKTPARSAFLLAAQLILFLAVIVVILMKIAKGSDYTNDMFFAFMLGLFGVGIAAYSVWLTMSDKNQEGGKRKQWLTKRRVTILFAVIAMSIGVMCLILGWFKRPSYYIPGGLVLLIIVVGSGSVASVKLAFLEITFKGAQDKALTKKGKVLANLALDKEAIESEGTEGLMMFMGTEVPRQQVLTARDKSIIDVAKQFKNIEKATTTDELIDAMGDVPTTFDVPGHRDW